MQRERRTPSNIPPPTVETSPSMHTIQIQLPKCIKHEMVTISVLKPGDKLKIIADAWHMETDCHYEWVVNFLPQDTDMSSVHAKLDPSGLLVIDVRRRPSCLHA
ncbi:hypothetical protein GYMLUDRAFT_154531 [Collybiopsis luxurians FD-317 M1]|nr:hypothetical protein GYMLUDRAFT_154531 [Collybiopsis luxurians FD-317 M1]